MLKNKESGKIINRERLVSFVAEYAFEPMWVSTSGQINTLSDEMAAIAKMVSRADVCRIVVNPYRARLAYSMAELSEKEKIAEVKASYRRAAKKILWLNSICRVRMGRPFVEAIVSMDSMDEVENLVDEFQAEIRHASLDE